MDLISIVIVACRRENLLKNCILSIDKQNLENYKLEIIIVNDDIDNNLSLENFQNFTKFKIQLINNRKKKHMIKSRNIGAERSNGNFILFIDDDNILDRNMIKNLHKFFKMKKTCAIVGPAMYDKNDILYLTSQKINLFTSKTTGFVNATKTDHFKTDGIPNCFMVKSNYLKSIGYFNEELRQTFTEPDITFAIRKKFKKESYIYTKAKINHQVDIKNFSRKIGSNFNIKAYCLIRNRVYIVTKYGNNLQKSFFFMTYPFWPIIYSLLSIMHKNPKLIRHYINGFIHGYKLFLNNKKIDNSYLEKEFT